MPKLFLTKWDDVSDRRKTLQDGEIRPLAAYWGDEHPPAQNVIDELSLVLIANAFPHNTAALGLAYDIHFAEPKDAPKRDAIKVDIEHADGQSVSVIVPYTMNQDGTITLEEALSEPKAPQWFIAHADA